MCLGVSLGVGFVVGVGLGLCVGVGFVVGLGLCVCFVLKIGFSFIMNLKARLRIGLARVRRS